MEAPILSLNRFVKRVFDTFNNFRDKLVEQILVLNAVYRHVGNIDHLVGDTADEKRLPHRESRVFSEIGRIREFLAQRRRGASFTETEMIIDEGGVQEYMREVISKLPGDNGSGGKNPNRKISDLLPVEVQAIMSTNFLPSRARIRDLKELISDKEEATTVFQLVCGSIKKLIEVYERDVLETEMLHTREFRSESALARRMDQISSFDRKAVGFANRKHLMLKATLEDANRAVRDTKSWGTLVQDFLERVDGICVSCFSQFSQLFPSPGSG